MKCFLKIEITENVTLKTTKVHYEKIKELLLKLFCWI